MIKSGQTEQLIDWLAAAWMAGCAGFAVARVASYWGFGTPAAAAILGAIAGAALTYPWLTSMRQDRLALPIFDLVQVDSTETSDELLLTERVRVVETELLLTRGQVLHPKIAPQTAELLLNDVLDDLQPDSRVVQLFDPARMPTAGELKSRIDRHLRDGRTAGTKEQQADASQALYDALADLRRSLG